MASTVYSYEQKLIECDQCAAPLSLGKEGGQVRCEYCDAEITVRARVVENRVETQIDEVSRVNGLLAQAPTYTPQICPPPGMESFATMLASPATRKAGEEAYRQEWVKTRRLLTASPGDAAAETRLFQLAVTLAQQYRSGADDTRARTTLETALDMLSDGSQRDIIRCRLARAALRLGDGQAAQAWLADVDARSVHYEPDMEYRVARGLLHLAGEDFAALKDLLAPVAEAAGRRAAIVPCLWAHALAGTGDREGARRVITRAALGWEARVVRQVWGEFPGPSSALVRTGVRGRLKFFLVPAGLALIPIIFGMSSTCTPALTLTCGDEQAYHALLDKLRSCRGARATLGDNITWSFDDSWNCQTRDCAQRCYFPVKGDKAWGVARFAWVVKDGRRQIGSGGLAVGRAARYISFGDLCK